jgi:hypothetical protein
VGLGPQEYRDALELMDTRN